MIELCADSDPASFSRRKLIRDLRVQPISARGCMVVLDRSLFPGFFGVIEAILIPVLIVVQVPAKFAARPELPRVGCADEIPAILYAVTTLIEKSIGRVGDRRLLLAA